MLPSALNMLFVKVTFHYNVVKRYSGAFYETVKNAVNFFEKERANAFFL